MRRPGGDVNRIACMNIEFSFSQAHAAPACDHMVELLGLHMAVQLCSCTGKDGRFRETLPTHCVIAGVHKLANLGPILGDKGRDGAIPGMSIGTHCETASLLIRCTARRALRVRATRFASAVASSRVMPLASACLRAGSATVPAVT